MVIQGIVKGNTVMLEDSESLEALDGHRVLLTIVSEFRDEESGDTISKSRLEYLKELRLRERRPTGRSASEIDQYIRECRDHDRF